MALPKRLQNQKEDAETLLNLLQEQKNNLWEDHIFFKNNPNIISNNQNLKDEILQGAENLDISEEEPETDRAALWEELLNFVERLKQYHKLTSAEWTEVPDRMHYKPQTNQEALDFFQTLFDKIENELSQDFKDGFDQTSPVTIETAQNNFEEWKKWIKWEDWDVYMDKLNNISRFIHFLRGSLRMTGMTIFEIDVNLHWNEE